MLFVTPPQPNGDSVSVAHYYVNNNVAVDVADPKHDTTPNSIISLLSLSCYIVLIIRASHTVNDVMAVLLLLYCVRTSWPNLVNQAMLICLLFFITLFITKSFMSLNFLCLIVSKSPTSLSQFSL